MSNIIHEEDRFVSRPLTVASFDIKLIKERVEQRRIIKALLKGTGIIYKRVNSTPRSKLITPRKFPAVFSEASTDIIDIL